MDGAAEFAAHDVFARQADVRGVPVRVDCGDDDPFATAARALSDGVPVTEAQFGHGFHESAFWRSRGCRPSSNFSRRSLGASTAG